MTFGLALRRAAWVILSLGIVLPFLYAQEARPSEGLIYGLDEKIEGKTYEQWTVAFIRWAYGIKKDRSPITDKTGEFAAEGQAGPVWFLGGNFGGTTRRRIIIPAGKRIFSPLIYELGRALPPARVWGNRLKDVDVTLDGKTLGDLTKNVISPPTFDFTGPDEVDAVHPFMAGKRRVAMVGSWFMLKPLPAGEHTLRIRGRSQAPNVEDDFELDITYTLKVEEKDKKSDEGQEVGTLVDLITTGASVIAVFRLDAAARGGEGGRPKEVHLKLDSLDDAGELAESLLDSRRKEFGDNHWRVTDARLMFEQLKKMEKLSEPERLRLAEAAEIHDLAREHLKKGQPLAALPLGERALETRRQLLGEEAPLSMVSLNDVAYCHESTRNYAKAQSLYERSLATHKKVLGEHHPDYAFVLSSLGGMHYEMGEYSKSEPLWEQALAIRKEALGEMNADYASSLNNLASLRGEQGRYREAETLYRKALAIRGKVLGEKDPDYAASLDNLAKTYNLMGQYAKAEPLFDRALAIRKATLGEQHPDYAASLERLAGLYGDFGRNDKAKELCDRALAIRRVPLGGKERDYAIGLNNVGYLYSRYLAQYTKAEPLYQEALIILNDTVGEKHPDYLRCLYNLASLYDASGQYAKAEPIYQKVLTARQAVLGRDHPNTAEAFSELASVYYHLGQDAKADSLADEALAIRRKALGENHPGYADGLRRRAEFYIAKRQYAKAEPLLQRALAIRKDVVGEKHRDYLASLGDLVGLYMEWKRFAEAETLGQRALAVAREVPGDRSHKYAATLHKLASLYARTGEFAMAEELNEQALALCKETSGQKSAAYVTMLCNLASNYKEMAQYSKAIPLLLQARTLGKEVLGEKHPRYLGILSGLAGMHRELGNYSTAIQLCREVVRIRREVLGERHPDYASGLHELAMVYCDTKEYGRAATIYRTVLEIEKQNSGENSSDYAATLYNLGTVYFDMEEHAQSEPLFLQSAAISKSVFGDKDPRYATVLDGLATHYKAIGNYSKAESSSREALRITRSHLERTADAQTEQQQLAFAQYCQLKLNRYLTITLGSKARAEDVYPEVLSWKGMVWSRQLTIHRMLDVLRAAGPETTDLVAKLAVARRKFADLTLSEGNLKSDPKRAEQTTAKSDEIEKLEKSLARKSAPYQRQLEERTLTLDRLRDCLPADAVMIDFLEYWHHAPRDATGPGGDEPCLTAFVIRRGHPVARVELGALAPIAKLVARWRETIVARPDGAADDPALELRRTIWEPLEPYVKDARLVLVSPDASLGRFPFAALPGRKPGTYLIEELAIAVVAVPHMLPDLLSQQRLADQAPSALLVGDVDYDRADSKTAGSPGKPDFALPEASTARPVPLSRGRMVPRGLRGDPTRLFPPLPGSAPEITAIRESFRNRYPAAQVTELRGAGANKDAVLRQAGHHRVVHLATHGFFAENSDDSAITANAGVEKPSGIQSIGRSPVGGLHPGLLSGIALAGANRPGATDDGILTALEVADLDMAGVDLVVLSACGTGLGKPARAEGLQGLQRALQVAGARTVIASLWDVPDRATQLLMERFYDNLWQKKKSKLEALREAQLWVLKEMPRNPDLFRGGLKREQQVPDDNGRSAWYWAAFVLSGDWR